MKTPMKKIFITLFLVISLFAVGCVTTKANISCPPENVILPVLTPFGLIPVMIEKGFLNPENEGSDWMTEEDYNKYMMEDEEQPQSGEKDFDYKHEGQSVNKL